MSNENQKEFFIETEEGREMLKEEMENADRPIRVLSLFYPKESEGKPETVDFTELLEPAVGRIEELEKSLKMVKSHLEKANKQTDSFRKSREILISQLKKVYSNIETELDKHGFLGDGE